MPRWPPSIFGPPRFTATGTTPSGHDSPQTDAVVRAQALSPVTLLQLGQNTVFHLARACPPRQLIALDLVPGLDVGQGRERVLQVGQKVVAIEPDVGSVGLSGHDFLPHDLLVLLSREFIVRYRANPAGFRH